MMMVMMMTMMMMMMMMICSCNSMLTALKKKKKSYHIHALGKAHICSLMLPRSLCWSDRLTTALSRLWAKGDCRALPLFLRLSSPGDRLCIPVLSGKPCVSNSATFQIFRAASRLCWSFRFSLGLSALSFPSILACPGQETHRSIWRWTPKVVTC